MASLLERYAGKIKGMLSCFDRIIVQGTLPGICHAAGMTAYLKARGIRIFDYPTWAQQWRDLLRTHIETIAAAEGLPIEFIRKIKSFRKEDRVQEILAQRGRQPGVVHIFSAMETCTAYKPWHDKRTGQTFLKPDSGKCLHYYLYFIDKDLGLCYLRLPTWCPFRLQFYCNGHNLLAAQLRARGIPFELRDNAFVACADFATTQQLADTLRVSVLHTALDRLATRYCPILQRLELTYHWSIMQVEYATDLLFADAASLADLYEVLVRTAIHAVKAAHVATFLGRKLTDHFAGELGTDFTTRLQGTRIKHHMGPASIKMYDKFGLVLRIETTTNDVSFFKHHRTVEQKDGRSVFKLAPVRKTIYSLVPDLRDLLRAANLRYLAFLSDLDDPSAGIKALRKVAEPVQQHDRRYRGFNFFTAPDQRLFELLARGEFCISGLRNKDLRSLSGNTTAQISYLFKRLRLHGLIKKIGRTYKYYLTEFRPSRHPHRSQAQESLPHPRSRRPPCPLIETLLQSVQNLTRKGLNGCSRLYLAHAARGAHLPSLNVAPAPFASRGRVQVLDAEARRLEGSGHRAPIRRSRAALFQPFSIVLCASATSNLSLRPSTRHDRAKSRGLRVCLSVRCAGLR